MLIILVTGYSCSVEKNTNLSRFYHNLTSRYNIYFNGYQSYMEGLKRISTSNRDIYSAIMPVFEYSNPDAASSANADMERVIQKCSKLIGLHSMTAKPESSGNEQLSDREKEFYNRKDYNNWVDDSYLLMGKAQLIQQKYNEARITLLHNIRESDNIDLRNESSIWLARVNSEMRNFNEASRILDEIRTGGLNDELLTEYYLTRCDIQMKQGNFMAATEPLSLALDKSSKAINRERLTYILARLYEENGNAREAERYYRQVLKLGPPYEMEFNARINLAGVFDVATGDIDEINRELNKLLKDAKNKEYKDQIYYALGNLSMREGKTEEAIEYIRLSAAASSTNTTQKGRSYLMLADWYYNLPDYARSQVYYDSAVFFLPEEYPGYSQFHQKSLNLNELIGHLSAVAREDSLQYVAALPVPQREALINGIIQKLVQEEQQAEAQLDQRYNMGEFYENQRRFQGDIEATGKWYFYNQSALTFGRSEFRNRWGERKLEDNWRRLNKARTGNSIINEEVTGSVTADTSSAANNNRKPEFYLRNLPLTDSLVDISNENIARSLFNAARIFQDRVPDTEQANQNYNMLITRFPDNELVPQALYNLYNLNKEAKPSSAEIYRNRLISGYPDTEFALMLSDPNYFETLVNKSKAEEKLYNEAYSAWKNNDMAAAVRICDRGIEEYGSSDLAPKFRLLRAYALARTIDERSLKEELTVITLLFPGSEEAKRASELIAYLNREIPELKVEEEQEIARELYSSDLEGEHYFIIVIKNKSLDVNRLTFDVINFNIDNYTNDNFSSRGELVSDSYIQITVGPFKEGAAATTYYNSFIPKEILRNTGEAEIISFIITSANLDKLNSDRDPDRYNLFFRENYPGLNR